MKVMTAMYTMRRGGAYDRFLKMLNALLERGVEVHCLSVSSVPVDHPLFHLHRVLSWNERHEGFLVKGLVFLLFPWWAAFIARRQRIDILVAFGIVYAFIFAGAKFLLGRPMVTFVRGDVTTSFEGNPPGSFLKVLIRFVGYLGLLFSDRIVVVNQKIKEDVLRSVGSRRQDRVVLLPNDIPILKLETSSPPEIRRRFGIPEEAKLIVTAGILNPSKNVEILLEALRIIGDHNLYLIVAGDGPNRKALEERSRAWGLEGSVIFAGWLSQKDLWSLFRAADLFVLSSQKEGMPNAMLEALGLGLPCIGSRVPGIVDILDDDKFFFEPADQKALARKIEHLFSDSQVYLSLKDACQERAKQFIFDWDEKVFRIVTQSSPYGGQAPCRN